MPASRADAHSPKDYYGETELENGRPRSPTRAWERDETGAWSGTRSSPGDTWKTEWHYTWDVNEGVPPYAYGPAGQLLEARGPEGVTRYGYDGDGNLIEKVEPDNRAWRYEWNAAGMLARVVRPDGWVVEFGYDVLGRRTFKKFRGKVTRWVWDGNVPLHE